MVKHFGENKRNYFLDIINASWIKVKLSKMSKISIIAPIVKPGESPEECKNYRLIPLTNIFCKVMERIVHKRVMTELLNENKSTFIRRPIGNTIPQKINFSVSVNPS